MHEVEETRGETGTAPRATPTRRELFAASFITAGDQLEFATCFLDRSDRAAAFSVSFLDRER